MSKMNRLANCHNHYQGHEKRVLCVCSAGLLRSPTTAYVLQKEYGYNTRAVGVSEEYALIPLDDVLIEWADEIVFMEDRHKDVAEAKYPQIAGKKVQVLNVPDNYERMNLLLQEAILQKYKAE